MTWNLTTSRWPRIDQRTATWGVAILLLEAFLVLTYFTLTTSTITEPRYLLYPFIWINAGLWAVVRTKPYPGNRRHQLLGVAAAATYLFVVMYLPGNIGFAGDGSGLIGFRIGWAAPGWGPIIAYTSPWLRLYLVPFEVIGYTALSYLVYANVLELTRGALSGILGLATCVGCTVPVVAPLVGLLGGPAASLTTTVYAWSYDVGTVIFLLTVGLLYWSHRRGPS